MYSVTFLHTETGREEFSGIKQTIRAARSWQRFLARQKYTANVKIWRGRPGEELVDIMKEVSNAQG